MTMQTPSLRLRVIGAVMVAWIVLVLSLDVFVFLSLRSQLLDSLDDLLQTRAQLALELGATLDPAELDRRLTELGVPAVVIAPDGTRLTADPASPGFGAGPPAPADRLREPVVAREVELASGVTVRVLATRAGVERTMDQVLILEIVGSLAVLGLMLLLLLRASRVVLGPIDQIVSTARRIGAGRTGERLRPDRPETELGQMAVAFDEMLDSLEAAIEQSKQSERDARESEARSRRFLADAAHQLRTPIAGLRASVDSLLRTSDPEEQEQMLDNLARETARTSRLVTSLLRVAELDRGEPMQRSRADLLDVVRSEVLRARTFAPRLSITLEEPAAPVPIDMNVDAVAEAISNLLDNARRHAATTVAVAVTDDGGWAEVAVADDGPGLPPELAERAFERFSSFDDRGGSGLGLPIARSIARSHGGDVHYRDGAFVLVLPSALHEPSPQTDSFVDRPILR